MECNIETEVKIFLIIGIVVAGLFMLDTVDFDDIFDNDIVLLVIGFKEKNSLSTDASENTITDNTNKNCKSLNQGKSSIFRYRRQLV